MSEDFGPTFITVTDEDGKEIVLEFVDALEYNGQMYQAFFPAETEGEEEDPDAGLVILKTSTKTARTCCPPWTPTRSWRQSTSSLWSFCSATKRNDPSLIKK